MFFERIGLLLVVYARDLLFSSHVSVCNMLYVSISSIQMHLRLLILFHKNTIAYKRKFHVYIYKNNETFLSHFMKLLMNVTVVKITFTDHAFIFQKENNYFSKTKKL